MPLDSLNNRQYIKDDVLFIKIIVDWTRWCWGHHLAQLHGTRLRIGAILRTAPTAAVTLPHFYIFKIDIYIIEITRSGKLVFRDLHTRRLPRVPRDECFGHLVTAFELQRSS
jgi:hypothetical protein